MYCTMYNVHDDFFIVLYVAVNAYLTFAMSISLTADDDD